MLAVYVAYGLAIPSLIVLLLAAPPGRSRRAS
jgi:hypothetical protein